MSTERIIVQRSIAESFRKVLVDTTEKVFGTNAPPTFLVTPASIEKNKKLISDAVFKGASVLFGDPNTHEPRPTSMRPLIVENVTKEMDLYRTESLVPRCRSTSWTAKKKPLRWPTIPNMASQRPSTQRNYDEVSESPDGSNLGEHQTLIVTNFPPDL